MRVRGLKCFVRIPLLSIKSVAPHAGAWIEIVTTLFLRFIDLSHPMRVRGLKSASPTRM